MPLELPQVRHVYRNHHLDAPRWEQVAPRAGDIVIATAYKSGTTLTQTIIANLLHPDGDLPGPANDLGPWIEMRLTPFAPMLAQLEAMRGRRCMKSHLPLDGQPYHGEVQYVVVSRDPRDVFMSLVNHYSHYTEGALAGLNAGDDRLGDPFPAYGGDPHGFWRDWIGRGWFDWESDGYPFWSHLHHAATWWEFRHLPNIKLIHYNDLRADLEGRMRSLADWLQIAVPQAAAWPRGGPRLPVRDREGQSGTSGGRQHRPPVRRWGPDLHPPRRQRPVARLPLRSGAGAL